MGLGQGKQGGFKEKPKIKKSSIPSGSSGSAVDLRNKEGDFASAPSVPKSTPAPGREHPTNKIKIKKWAEASKKY